MSSCQQTFKKKDVVISKNCPVKGLAAGVYLSGSLEAQKPISPPPPLTHCILVHIQHAHSHNEGGRVEPERRGEGQQFTKLSRKYQHGLLYLQSINSDKHLPQSPFKGHFFQMTT